MRTSIERDLLFEYNSLTQEMRDIRWAVKDKIITFQDGERRLNEIEIRQTEIESIFNGLKLGYFK